jgi:hypothetical protein
VLFGEKYVEDNEKRGEELNKMEKGRAVLS